MVFSLSCYLRIRKPFTRTHSCVDIFSFHAYHSVVSREFDRNVIDYAPKTNFDGHPFACIAFYSSWLRKGPDFDGHRTNGLGTGYAEKSKLDVCSDGSGRCGKMGYRDNVDRRSFGEGGWLDEEEIGGEDEDGGDADDEDLLCLNGVNRIQGQRREIRRVEIEEDEFRHPLVREVCKLIQLQSAWNPKLEGELRSILRSLKPRQVCAVLLSQADERVALKFFYWADRQWRYRHDPIVYYVMLEVLSKTKLYEGARRVLRLMLRRSIACSSEAFSHVMVSYSRAGKLRDAMKVLFVMQKAGLEPDLLVCNTTVHVLVMGNRLESALRFMKRMELVGIIPNVVTYNFLIKGYCDLHQTDNAVDLIAKMPLKGCSPDKVSYHTVMGYLCKEKRIEEVRKMMEKMVNDSKLIIDQVTYNTLIHMLSKNGQADEAREFLSEAEESGFKVDKVGYSAVIDSICKEGRMDVATELVKAMLSKGCLPDVVTYTAIVDGYCRAGKVDEAKKVIQEMYKHGCKPNTVSYTALLNGLCQSGNSLEAQEMLNKSEEEWWTPNSITYSVVVNGLRKEGKLVEACNLVKEMIQKGFFPTPVEINLLIQPLCRDGKVDEAKKFLQECLNKGCAVNVVNFSTVIHGYCLKGDLEAALSLFDDMYLCDKKPDAITYTTLIDALGRKGKMEEATELMMKMLGKGLYPTPATYRIVIHWYCRTDRVEDLLKLLEKMLLRQKCRTAYNQVIEKLCSFGCLDQAYKLLGKILTTASQIDAKTCLVLIENYLLKGTPLSAYKVACRMFKRNLVPDLKLCDMVCKRLMDEGKAKEADNLRLRFLERGLISPCSWGNLES